MMKEIQIIVSLAIVAVIALSMIYYLSLSSVLSTNSRDSGGYLSQIFIGAGAR
ncbi:MAG: hypothetical protein ACE5KT_11580 [Methanosarcinales archaeon]